MKIKKFYYYSPEKFKLVPIENFLTKLVIGISIVALLFTTSVFLVGKFVFANHDEIAFNQKQVKVNETLSKEFKKLKTKYEKLNNKLSKVIQESNTLRLAVNLEPLKEEDRNVGVGGSIFRTSIPFTTDSEDLKLKDLYTSIEKIESNLNFEANNYKKIKTKFEKNKDLFKVLPAIKPVEAPYGDRFGYRFHPILKIKRMHNGIDFLANVGENVYAPGDGIITFVGNKGGYGKVIKINHGFGYETLYAHLSKTKVKKGQKVKRGDLIALTGNTGSLSTGPHLHYEVRHNGVALNPRNFIYDDIKLFEINNKNMVAKN
jgi:murein DD-endopeptidase MepM/ murein hydrolase activator NlpD